MKLFLEQKSSILGQKYVILDLKSKIVHAISILRSSHTHIVLNLI